MVPDSTEGQAVPDLQRADCVHLFGPDGKVLNVRFEVTGRVERVHQVWTMKKFAPQPVEDQDAQARC